MTRWLPLALFACVASLLIPAPATADPFDPHMPDLTKGYCPGGRGHDWLMSANNCDGIEYEDGSFWHQAKTDYSSSYIFKCTMEKGTIPPPAPVGACGGAWQGE